MPVDASQRLIETRIRAQSKPQVVAHAQILEERMLLRRIGDAGCDEGGRRCADDRGAVEPDLARAQGDEAQNRLEQGGLAHAVLAHEGEDLARGHRQ